MAFVFLLEDEDVNFWRALLSYISAVVLMLLAGCNFAYASYSNDMVIHFKISPSQSTFIFTVGCLGGVGVLAGWVVDRCGVRCALLVGTTLASTGQALLYSASVGQVPASFPALLVYYCVSMQGLIFLYMGSFLNVKNVHHTRAGIGLGILDTCYGLSSVLFSRLYAWLFASTGDVSGLFLLQFIAVLSCGILGTLVSYVPRHAHERQGNATRTEVKDGLKSPVYWMLFIAIGLAQMTMAWHVGSVGNQINSLGVEVEASTLNTIMMLCGVLTRTIAGAASDYVSCPRATFLVLFVTPACIAFALLAISGGSFLVEASIIVGIGFGASWCLIPLQIKDSFGPAFGSLWGLALVAAGFGPSVMQQIESYALSAHAQSASECKGLPCYQFTYICASSLCGVLVVLTALAGTKSKSLTVPHVIDSFDSQVSVDLPHCSN